MTEKNIYVNNFCLLLNISDFILFLCKNCNTPWKKSPFISQQPPTKNWDPGKPTFLKKFGRKLNPPSPSLGETGGGRGGCTLSHYTTGIYVWSPEKWILNIFICSKYRLAVKLFQHNQFSCWWSVFGKSVFFKSTLFHFYFTRKQMRIYSLKKLMHICVFYETIKVSNLEQVTERVIPKI